MTDPHISALHTHLLLTIAASLVAAMALTGVFADEQATIDADSLQVTAPPEHLHLDPFYTKYVSALAYTKPGTRLRHHLAGYDPNTMPAFRWPARLDTARQEIREEALKHSREAAANGTPAEASHSGQ